MHKKFIKLAPIFLVGLSIFSILTFFVLFKAKNNTNSEAPKEEARDVSPDSNASSGDSNLDKISVDVPDNANTSSPGKEPTVAGEESEIPVKSSYPLHTNITTTVFWIGEPKGSGSSEDNAISTYDDKWLAHYGGFDDYRYIRTSANGYFPKDFTPKENPFYLDLPYDDVNNSWAYKNRLKVIPWAAGGTMDENYSYMKNRWVKIMKGAKTCYGQIEDAGPYYYKDSNYVFGLNDARPYSKKANNAGMDVSPALRDCLGFVGLNNDTNKVSWQFIESKDVPKGPWKNVITTSGTFWK